MERQLLIQETANEGPAGMTYTYSFKSSAYAVEIESDAYCRRLRLSTAVGEFQYTSEWLDVSPLLEPDLTGPRIKEEAERLRVACGLLYSGPKSGLTPLGLTCWLIRRLDHLLA